MHFEINFPVYLQVSISTRNYSINNAIYHLALTFFMVKQKHLCVSKIISVSINPNQFSFSRPFSYLSISFPPRFLFSFTCFFPNNSIFAVNKRNFPMQLQCTSMRNGLFVRNLISVMHSLGQHASLRK